MKERQKRDTIGPQWNICVAPLSPPQDLGKVLLYLGSSEEGGLVLPTPRPSLQYFFIGQPNAGSAGEYILAFSPQCATAPTFFFGAKVLCISYLYFFQHLSPFPLYLLETTQLRLGFRVQGKASEFPQSFFFSIVPASKMFGSVSFLDRSFPQLVISGPHPELCACSTPSMVVLQPQT